MPEAQRRCTRIQGTFCHEWHLHWLYSRFRVHHSWMNIMSTFMVSKYCPAVATSAAQIAAAFQVTFHINSSRRVWLWRSRGLKHMKNAQHTHFHVFGPHFWPRISAGGHAPRRPGLERIMSYTYLVATYFNIFSLNQVQFRAPELILSASGAKSRSQSIGTIPGSPKSSNIEQIAKSRKIEKSDIWDIWVWEVGGRAAALK